MSLEFQLWLLSDFSQQTMYNKLSPTPSLSLTPFPPDKENFYPNDSTKLGGSRVNDRIYSTHQPDKYLNI